MVDQNHIRPPPSSCIPEWIFVFILPATHSTTSLINPIQADRIMKLQLGFAILLFSTVLALPSEKADVPQFTVPSSMTVEQGSSKCGTQAQLSCCNKAKYGGDTTAIGGALSNLLGAGSAAEGLGIFTECSKLDISRMPGACPYTSPLLTSGSSHRCRRYPQPAV
jgi:hypothetical protein